MKQTSPNTSISVLLTISPSYQRHLRKRYGVVFKIRTDYQEIIVLPKLYGRRIFIVLILRNESVKALLAVFHDVLIGKNCQSIKKYEKIGDLNDPLSTYRVSVKLKSQNGSSPVKQD